MSASVGATKATVFPELDTLRGLAIMMVLGTHAEGWIAGGVVGPTGELPLGRALLRFGHTSVSLFFVLSAFLLARPFWVEILGGTRVELGAYARHRFWRIVPLYALAVLAATLITSRAHPEYAAPYLAFVPQGFIPEDRRLSWIFSAAWWSLATEVEFYCLLPFMALARRSRAGAGVGVVVLVLVTIGWLTLINDSWTGWDWATIFTLRHTAVGRTPIFAWGIAAAFVSVRFADRLRSSWPRSSCTGIADVLLLGFVGAGFAALGRFERGLQYAQLETLHPTWHVAEGAAWALVILGVLYAPLRWRRFFVARPLVWIGQISYSIYLLHMPVFGYGLLLLRRLWPGQLQGWSGASATVMLGLVVLTVALSSFTYERIERPLMRFGRRRRGAGSRA